MIRAASDWRHDDLQASFPDDRVYFSVAQALTSDDDVRPLIDANPVKPLATPIIAAITLSTLFPWSACPGSPGDLRLEAQVPVFSSTFVRQDVLVDPFMASTKFKVRP